MTTPPAATAVVRATLEDAHLAELLQRPGMTAHRIVSALETAGWTITPTRTTNTPQHAA
ncbi:hypothetical protein [Streptomyces sp. NPDC054962]